MPNRTANRRAELAAARGDGRTLFTALLAALTQFVTSHSAASGTLRVRSFLTSFLKDLQAAPEVPPARWATV